MKFLHPLTASTLLVFFANSHVFANQVNPNPLKQGNLGQAGSMTESGLTPSSNSDVNEKVRSRVRTAVGMNIARFRNPVKSAVEKVTNSTDLLSESKLEESQSDEMISSFLSKPELNNLPQDMIGLELVVVNENEDDYTQPYQFTLVRLWTTVSKDEDSYYLLKKECQKLLSGSFGILPMNSEAKCTNYIEQDESHFFDPQDLLTQIRKNKGFFMEFSSSSSNSSQGITAEELVEHTNQGFETIYEYLDDIAIYETGSRVGLYNWIEDMATEFEIAKKKEAKRNKRKQNKEKKA